MRALSPELLALLGIVCVHLFPKMLQRLRIPAPVTALILGGVAAAFLPSLAIDPTLDLLSTLGISSLFLFAGLEVDAEELGKQPGLLVAGLLVHAALLVLGSVFGVLGLGLEMHTSMLLALGVVTPSGGFILDGLSGLGATPEERHRIRDSALVAEILSLVVFFFVTQSRSLASLGFGTLALVLLVVLVPLLLRLFSRILLPHAPNSEFALLVLAAAVGAYATKKLDIYYVLGAFVVGIVARRLKSEVPELASERNLTAIELFAAFFAPFYFARAGMTVNPASLGLRSLGLGAVLLAFAVPLRIALVSTLRHVVSGEPMRSSVRVSTALVPTFVFSLVMARVIEDRFDAPTWVPGGLLVFAIGNAFVPTVLFRSIRPHAPPLDPSAAGEPTPEPAAPTPVLAVEGALSLAPAVPPDERSTDPDAIDERP